MIHDDSFKHLYDQCIACLFAVTHENTSLMRGGFVARTVLSYSGRSLSLLVHSFVNQEAESRHEEGQTTNVKATLMTDFLQKGPCFLKIPQSPIRAPPTASKSSNKEPRGEVSPWHRSQAHGGDQNDYIQTGCTRSAQAVGTTSPLFSPEC